MKIIKGITNTEIRNMIDGLKCIKESYENNRHHIGLSCRLCELAASSLRKRSPYARYWNISDYSNRCDYCPWKWFTGQTCIDYGMLNYNKGLKMLDVYYNKTQQKNRKIVKQRIKQIDEWIRQLEEIV